MFASCNKSDNNSSNGKLTVTTKSVTEITSSSAKCGGDVTSTGNFSVGLCGVCWGESPSPTTENYFTTDNQGLGDFTSEMKNLKPETKYYVRAYATTSSGVMYGEEMGFTTLSDGGGNNGGEQNDDLPLVHTGEVFDITNTSAKCGGEVISDGGYEVTDCGLCWGTSENPMIHNSHVSCGSGTGLFEGILSNLLESTVYYVRAYATNEKGTGYGTQKPFTTSHTIYMPTVVTGEITNIGQTSVTCEGNVTSNGNDMIIACGICYGQYQEPDITGTHTNVGTETGEFSSQLWPLSANTLYYYRAYVTNSKGTAYGEQKTFTTLDWNEYDVYGVRFKMVKIEGGTFYMGAQNDSPNGINYYNTYNTSSSEPVHQVTLSDYYMGKYEVTQELWEAVMGSNPSHFIGDSKRPVESVSWNDCQSFIERLNHITGESFRLPTEAEWEFAARGGANSHGYLFSGGNNLTSVAWCKNNSNETTHPVGLKSPNELGIYDMTGNVREMCYDRYGPYTSEAQTNPTGYETGNRHVNRGADYIVATEYSDHTAWAHAVWYRDYTYSEVENRNTMGLRLAK